MKKEKKVYRMRGKKLFCYNLVMEADSQEDAKNCFRSYMNFMAPDVTELLGIEAIELKEE